MIANPFGRRAQEVLTADANSGVLNVDFEAPAFEAPTFVNPTPDPKMKDLGYSQIAVSSRAACASACEADDQCDAFAVAGCDSAFDSSCAPDSESGQAMVNDCSEESGDANFLCNANCFLYHFGGGCLPTLTTTQCAGAYWLSDNTQCFVSAKTEADCQPPPSPAAPPPEPDARQCYVTVHVYDTDFDSEDEYVISTYMRPGGGGGRRLQTNPLGLEFDETGAFLVHGQCSSGGGWFTCSEHPVLPAVNGANPPGTGDITITTTASDAVANTDRTHDGSLVHARHTLTAVSTLYATNDAEDPPVDATFTAGERKVSGTFKGLAGFSSCTVSVDVWKQDSQPPRRS